VESLGPGPFALAILGLCCVCLLSISPDEECTGIAKRKCGIVEWWGRRCVFFSHRGY
jgi:hypothetical protein